MKRVVQIACSIVFIVIAFFMFAPESRVNTVKETWLRVVKNDAQMCLDQVRSGLKDPESARVISFTPLQDPEDPKRDDYVLKYKAKNSYGAYVTGEEYFTKGVAGWEVDSVYKLILDLKAKNREIKANIDAMQRANSNN